MPTFDVRDTFWRDYKNLTRDEKAAFLVAVGKFVTRPQGRAPARWFAYSGACRVPQLLRDDMGPDGRAIFELGPEVRQGEQHIVWRRVGTRDIFDAP